MIYTFGDSHSKFGWERIDGVVYNHIGPKLMFNFRKDIFKFVNMSDEDSLVFCFGEIDVRCHIKKHVIDDNYQDLITNMCNTYISEILKIKKEHNIKSVHIYSVTPTRRVDSKEPYNITCATYQVYNKEKAEPFPFIGSDSERKNYTLFINSELNKLAQQNNLGFINVYQDYIDKDGYLNMNLSDGTVHIENKSFLENRIKHLM